MAEVEQRISEIENRILQLEKQIVVLEARQKDCKNDIQSLIDQINVLRKEIAEEQIKFSEMELKFEKAITERIADMDDKVNQIFERLSRMEVTLISLTQQSTRREDRIWAIITPVIASILTAFLVGLLKLVKWG